MKTTERYDELIAGRAEQVIAQGALTNSKRPQSFVRGVYPTHLKKGLGCHVWDTKGNKYVDFICGLGTNLLGYAQDELTEAITRQAKLGASLSLGTEIEVQLAERLKNMFPYMEKFKFLKTGSEGCAAAVRMARAFQGVSYESESLFIMQGIEELFRISQIEQSTGRLSKPLQAVYSEISDATESHGNQTVSTGEIFENGEGTRHRETPQSQTAGENQNARQRQGLFHGKAQSFAQALRSMWGPNFSGTSHRLFAAARREMALSQTPCSGTPRGLILSDGYHGHMETFIGLTPPSKGVPFDPNVLSLSFNEDLIRDAAAVIIEPIITDFSGERISWLRELRAMCDKHRTILIYDETISALRVPGYSVANHTGIYPDLTVFGKALGNGMPISVVGGKKEIMDSDYFVSGTFFGETVSIASALKTVELLTTKHKIEYLWEKGKEFLKRFNSVWEGVQLEGYPTRSVLKGSPEHKALFMQECARAGILVGPSFFFNFHHIELMEEVLSTFTDILTRIRLGEVKLLGEMPQTPFAQKVREHDSNNHQ